MDRSQKSDLVAELKNVFTETSVVVITRNLGLSVAQSTELRLKMRDAGAQFKVAKNRLALIALEDTRYKPIRSEEHTSELQSHVNLVCRLLLEKKKTKM